jgi:molybdate transport system substrate-binding protein
VKLLLSALLLLALPGIASGAQPLVFAASSLRDALTDVLAGYEMVARNKVRVSYAATPALARQALQGAPADVFISADLEWMNYLQERSLIRTASRRNLLANRLVLIAPKESRVSVRIAKGFDLAHALGDGRLAIAQPDSVPAGRYAKTALTALGAWPGVQARLAPTDNVRAALALVARKEAPLGIVYATDAQADPRVRVVDTFAAGTHPPIVYPAAILSASRSSSAEALLSYLHGPEARAVWHKHGFTQP